MTMTIKEFKLQRSDISYNMYTVQKPFVFSLSQVFKYFFYGNYVHYGVIYTCMTTNKQLLQHQTYLEWTNG